MIKRSIQEEGITIKNVHAPNIGAPHYATQMITSMKGDINSNTIIVGDFNTPLTPMDRSTEQKITKETQTLNDTMDQLHLIDIYMTLHPRFSSVQLSRSVVSDSLRPHESQHARPSCPSPSPGVHSDSRPLSQ